MEKMIKICGLSTREAIEAAQTGGATHLGFIFFPKSPRNVSPDNAAGLVNPLSDIETVAVTVNADDAFLDEIVAKMHPTLLQLHGSESPERLEEVRKRYNLPIIKALAVRDQSDLEKVATYNGVADILLLDAKPPKGSDLPGGNGVSFDWSLLDQLQTQTPVLLSGGIDLNNVEDAMDHVRDKSSCITGLDVSSGVESAPGVKDDAKIKAFLEACLQD